MELYRPYVPRFVLDYFIRRPKPLTSHHEEILYTVAMCKLLLLLLYYK